MHIQLFGKAVFLSKSAVALFLGICLVVVAIFGYIQWNDSAADFVYSETIFPETASPQVLKETLPELKEIREFQIYIVGAVRLPGLYTFQEPILVYDLIQKAGGLLESADASYINMVQRLDRNIMIRILSEKERKQQSRETAVLVMDEASGSNSTSIQGDNFRGKVNLNTAGKAELMQLPGIGEAKAQDILLYREEKGGFQKIEEIMQVPGIKEARFQAIKDLITV